VRPPRSILPFSDVVLSVLPLAWILGRAGCSSVHDHPGAVAGAGSALSVAFPSPSPGDVDGPGTHSAFGPITFIDGHYPRYDLGLLELMWTVVLSVVLLFMWRRRLPTGTYVAFVSLAYAPARFAMDFLRIRSAEGGDPRYANLTPAQWCCVVLFLAGLAVVAHVRTLRARGMDPANAFRAAE
jgi:phosphatidylglycerol:prolipoprotein diacylglycerol transferase